MHIQVFYPLWLHDGLLSYGLIHKTKQKLLDHNLLITRAEKKNSNYA
jgi:hypothetical protein